MSKAKESPYTLFVKEYKQKNNCTLVQAYQLAGPLWEKMDEQQKRRFVDEANKRKKKPTPYVASVYKEEDERKHAMKEDITRTINSAHDHVLEHNFYVIHISHFFYQTSGNKYYPAEVAVARFNLRDGLETMEQKTIRGSTDTKPFVYHAYCNPGPMPTGYAADVKDCTHKLPYPNSDDSHQLETSTEAEIFQEIIQYLKQDILPNRTIPPVYTTLKMKNIVTSIIDMWLFDNGYAKDYIKVYSLEELFYQLNLASIRIQEEKNKRGGPPAAIPEAVNGAVHADLLICKDYFDFTPDIACEFHELSEVINECSKSIVIRWIYLICNYCCNPTKMVPIRHMPKNARVTLDRRSDVASNY